MIYSVTVTNYVGDSIKLDLRKPNDTGFLIYNIEGIGPGKANINTTEISTSDGSKFNVARLSQRNIVFSIMFTSTALNETIEQIRHKTYKYFPLKKEVELIFETEEREVRITGYVESNEPTIFSSSEGTQISIICTDPFFYSVKENTITNFYPVEPLFEFPFSNESLYEKRIQFGRIRDVIEGVIKYEGDTEIGIIIYIRATGPASDITITNVKTREVMKIDTDKIGTITGKPLQDKDDIIINTMKGNKSIVLMREGKTYNILNCLDKNTDWFTLSKGENVFGFAANTNQANLQFSVENMVIYEGI